MKKTNILIGNSFPLSLVRREINITPLDFGELRRSIAMSAVFSFWGHQNSLAEVSTLLQCDLTPLNERPSLMLSERNLPMLNGMEFAECYLVVPEYRQGFRPKINSEPEKSDILNWNYLKIIWKVE